jgi:hypothetical protein
MYHPNIARGKALAGKMTICCLRQGKKSMGSFYNKATILLWLPEFDSRIIMKLLMIKRLLLL